MPVSPRSRLYAERINICVKHSTVFFFFTNHRARHKLKHGSFWRGFAARFFKARPTYHYVIFNIRFLEDPCPSSGVCVSEVISHALLWSGFQLSVEFYSCLLYYALQLVLKLTHATFSTYENLQLTKTKRNLLARGLPRLAPVTSTRLVF